jgi:hypothetical protein
MSERVRVKGGGLYTKVVDRLTAFKEKYHPDHGYSIITNIESLTDNYVVFKAEIIAFTGDGTDKDKIVVATGHGFNAIAKEKSLEKAETVAVGRALAFFDPKFGGESELASQEEMDKFREMTKDDGSFNPPTQPKEQPKYNKDFVDKMEKNEPFLNGQRDKAMEQMNGGSNGKVDTTPTEEFREVMDAKIPFSGKNKGELVSKVAPKTLQWYVDNMDLDRWDGLEQCMMDWIEVSKQQKA